MSNNDSREDITEAMVLHPRSHPQSKKSTNLYTISEDGQPFIDHRLLKLQPNVIEDDYSSLGSPIQKQDYENDLDIETGDHCIESEQNEIQLAVKIALDESKFKAETEITDTGTIHMLAIKAVTDINPDSRNYCRMRPWFYALFSLSFVMIQSLALYMMAFESTTIPCSTHTDCQGGLYCEYDYGTGEGGTRQSDQNHQKALCVDCGILLGRLDPTKCNREEITSIQSVDQNVVWIDKNGYPVYDKSIYPHDDDYWCLAWQHCQQTERVSPNMMTTSEQRNMLFSTTSSSPPGPNRQMTRTSDFFPKEKGNGKEPMIHFNDDDDDKRLPNIIHYDDDNIRPCLSRAPCRPEVDEEDDSEEEGTDDGDGADDGDGNVEEDPVEKEDMITINGYTNTTKPGTEQMGENIAPSVNNTIKPGTEIPSHNDTETNSSEVDPKISPGDNSTEIDTNTTKPGTEQMGENIAPFVNNTTKPGIEIPSHDDDTETNSSEVDPEISPGDNSTEIDPEDEQETHHVTASPVERENDSIEQCDYLILVKNKFTSAQAFMFSCMIILLAVHMSVDIEESIIEEALLSKRGKMGHENSASTGVRREANIYSVPALILIVSLRLRRFVLPWALAMAVIVITLTEDLSMKNIMLNVVALEFIINADSLFARYWHKVPGQQQMIRTTRTATDDSQEEQGENIWKKGHHNKEIAVREGADYNSWWSSRVESLMIGMVIICTVLNIQTVVEAWYSILPGISEKRWWVGCERLLATLYLMLLFGPLLSSIVHAICQGILMLFKDMPNERNITFEDRQDHHHQSKRYVRKQKCNRVLFILFETLFQFMASCSACFLSILFRFFIDMAYYTPALVLEKDFSSFLTFVVLAVISWVIYALLGLGKILGSI